MTYSIQYISRMIEAVFLHKSIAIQSNLLYLLYTGYVAGFPAILDSFYWRSKIPLELL